MNLALELWKGYNPGAIRLRRQQYGLEKARAHAALEGTQSDIAFRGTEDPREQAALRQSLAGRGLGKSSIAQQDTARLSDMQARRMAALQSQQGIQERGLSLIRRTRKYQRRMMPFDIFGLVSQQAEQVGSVMAGMPGAGGGG